MSGENGGKYLAVVLNGYFRMKLRSTHASRPTDNVVHFDFFKDLQCVQRLELAKENVFNFLLI